jgi:hypothetical protein
MKANKWVRMSVGSAGVAVALVTGAGPALADEGPTTNPELNALLDGASGVAQEPLLPGLPPVPPGVDLNTAAMLWSSMIGVQNVYNGTSPVYANGTIAGMHDSLGIVFPNGGDQSTIDWALSLLDADGGGGVGSGGDGSPANYFYYDPVGPVGEPLTGPTLPFP